MTKRPPLSDSSFLAAVFHPKKNPVPVGLRKKKLTSVTGRKATRLKSYNSMSALNQRILDETKQREAYLRGDISIADAKRALRNKAVDLGIAKPLRTKATPTHAPSVRVGDTRTRVLDHLWRQLKGSKTRQPVNIGVLRRGTLMMRPDQLHRALDMLAPDIKRAANDPEEAIEVSEGKALNPFWYH